MLSDHGWRGAPQRSIIAADRPNPGVIFLPEGRVDRFTCKTPVLVSGGTRIRTGGTMIFSRRTCVLARPVVSTKSLLLQAFSEFGKEVCPLRTSLYQPGCSTVAVNPFEQTRMARESK